MSYLCRGLIDHVSAHSGGVGWFRVRRFWGILFLMLLECARLAFRKVRASLLLMILEMLGWLMDLSESFVCNEVFF